MSIALPTTQCNHLLTGADRLKLAEPPFSLSSVARHHPGPWRVRLSSTL